MNALRILGVDPGSQKAGWGILDVDRGGKTLRHVDNGVIVLERDAELPARLMELSRQLHQVIETHRPTSAAVEDVFLARGVRSALVLGQARGAVLATLGLCGLQVASYATTQVKSRVTGRGRATKEQLAHMVSVLLELQELPFEDAADALGVAICHASEELGMGVPVPKTKKSKASSTRGGFAELARAQGKIP